MLLPDPVVETANDPRTASLHFGHHQNLLRLWLHCVPAQYVCANQANASQPLHATTTPSSTSVSFPGPRSFTSVVFDACSGSTCMPHHFPLHDVHAHGIFLALQLGGRVKMCGNLFWCAGRLGQNGYGLMISVMLMSVLRSDECRCLTLVVVVVVSSS